MYMVNISELNYTEEGRVKITLITPACNVTMTLFSAGKPKLKFHKASIIYLTMKQLICYDSLFLSSSVLEEEDILLQDGVSSILALACGVVR